MLEDLKCIKNLKFVGDHGVSCEYTGETLEYKEDLKEFKRLHSLISGLNGCREGAKLSDIASEKEVDFYTSFQPEGNNDDYWSFVDANLWQFLENFARIVGPESWIKIPGWVVTGLDDNGIVLNHDQAEAMCSACHDFFDLDCDIAGLKDYSEENHCGKSPRCCP